MDFKTAREQAGKRVKQKKGFYMHLSVYTAVGLFFLAINIITFRESNEWWFFWPMLPWGVGLLIHYIGIFGFPGFNILGDEWEHREIERETRKILYDEGVDIDYPDDYDELELKELEKRRSRKYRDEDFI